MKMPEISAMDERNDYPSASVSSMTTLDADCRLVIIFLLSRDSPARSVGLTRAVLSIHLTWNSRLGAALQSTTHCRSGGEACVLALDERT